jgi:NAD-dependent SIR2 family protein deacetylase
MDRYHDASNMPIKIRTKDLYYSSALSNELIRPSFLAYHTKFRQSAKRCEPTLTHQFIRELCLKGQLLRNYTQNVDSMKDKIGLCTDLQRGVGIKNVERGVEYVQLHGNLRFLRCMYCNERTSWNRYDHITILGKQPVCPTCERISKARVAQKKRRSKPGALRPDIILYDEVHLQANTITDVKIHDLTRETPDVLVILGTRLGIKGVKAMVKEFAQSVHGRGGLVVYVNLTGPKAKEWSGIIDFWVEWDCDSWVEDLKSRNIEWSSSLAERAAATRNNTTAIYDEALSLRKRSEIHLESLAKRCKLNRCLKKTKTGGRKRIASRTGCSRIVAAMERGGQQLGSTAKFPIDLTV